jgi:tetratricopeptide (TPR) repeat protein
VAICRECEEGETHLSDDAIAQGLLSLVEKNMVKAEEHPSGAPRFRMLMTIGEYGQELLESSGEATALRRRHAAFYLDFAKDAVTRLQGHEQLLWLQRLDDELDNLRTAFAWRGDQAPLHEQQLFVAGALYPFWHLRGRYTEGVMWLERLLSEPVAQAPTIGRTRALQTAAALNASLDKQSEAYQQCNESLAIAQALGDPYELAQALRVIGSIDATLSAPESFVQSNGVMQLEESVRLMRTTGNLAGTVYAIAFLGFRLLRNWDYQGALAQFTEGLQIARKLGDRWTTGMNLLGLAEATWLLGDGVAAHTYAMQSLEQHQLLGDQHGMGHVLGLIGDLAQAAGELETAQSYYQQSLETLRVMAEAPRTVRTLWGMATLAATAGHIEQALMLAGAATHLSQTALVTAYSPDDARLAPLWTRANQRLGEEQIRTLWAGGQAMTLNQAVAYARALPETIANPDHSSLPQAPTADARDAI